MTHLPTRNDEEPYNFHDLHNAGLTGVDDAKFSQYAAKIDPLSLADKGKVAVLQGIINSVNNPTVVTVTSVTLDKKTLSLDIGTGGTTHYTFVPEVLPTTATNRILKWESSHPEFATVTSSGKVDAVAVGKTTITATATDGSLKNATCEVEVTKSGGGTVPGGGGTAGHFAPFALLLAVPFLFRGKSK